MKAEEIVEQFNRQFPVGSVVRWRSIGKDGVPYREYTVRYPAENHFGQAVAWLKERSGMVSVEPKFVEYPEGKF